MKIRYFMRYEAIKNLAILCMASYLPACANGDGGTQTAVGFNQDSVTVSWTAPTERSNGDPLSLSDIGGYRIYYGPQRGFYNRQVNIPDSTAQQATVTGERGYYFFVITTYDTAGRESKFSPVFEKRI